MSATPSSKYQEIGRINLTEQHTFRKLYETASWYTDISCPPQEVSLWSNGYYMKATFEGVVVGELFVNRLLGSSSISPSRNIGTSSQYTNVWYAYRAAKVDTYEGVVAALAADGNLPIVPA
jgi:hypothetical protein